MLLHSTTSHTVSRDELIVSCSDQVHSMAWKFARNASCVDADDMFSVGMLAICEAAPLLNPALNPYPYLLKTAKYAMINEYRRGRGWQTTTFSLDAPLSSSDGEDLVSLADLLPAPSAPAAPGRTHKTALNTAMLRNLTALQRGTLRRRYALPGYGTTNLQETARAMHTTIAAIDNAARQARRNLARDVQLCKKVGVEVTQ